MEIGIKVGDRSVDQRIARAFSDRVKSPDRKTLQINKLEPVLIGKVVQLFRNMLEG
jgi:hypothetical protein